MKGITDCIERYAQKRAISKAQAETEFKTALDVIADACVDGGVSFKGIFTIKKKVQKGRKGMCNGHEYETQDKNTLSTKSQNPLFSLINSIFLDNHLRNKR